MNANIFLFIFNCDWSITLFITDVLKGIAEVAIPTAAREDIVSPAPQNILYAFICVHLRSFAFSFSFHFSKSKAQPCNH
ncbi:MAG TPA: hypothetical protein VFY78_07835, partial [Gammaproteobacteria bacterium]|nr:hypothetical protein [Gammaproteobacteria bacterium]